MKRFVLGFIVLAFSAAAVVGQVRGRPEPTPQTPLQQAINRSAEISRRSKELNNVEKFPVKTNAERMVFMKATKPLYRKLTDEEKVLMAPSKEDSAKYAAFLKQKNTGLIKLVIDRGCSTNPKIVAGSKECSQYSMPGSGSAYSFRMDRHRIHRLADINFKKNTLQAFGTLTHGILVDLGNTPLDQVDLNSDGMKYIVKLKAAKSMPDAGELANKLTKGIKKDGYSYASWLPVKAGNTYVLRSIAYRGVIPAKAGGIAYNEIEEVYQFDKRKDIIIAFKAVRFAPNKEVTILWKELRDKKAPRLK